MGTAAPLAFWPPPTGQVIHIGLEGRTEYGGKHYVSTAATGWRAALRLIREYRARGFAVRQLLDSAQELRMSGRDSSD
jgi:hypothetical protein